jgi:uncharacterized membrane protein
MHGAWPVVPFAGLECVGLYAACRWLGRHQDDYQRVSVDGERVVVESRDGDELRRSEFSRAWVQVVVEDRPDGRSGTFLRSHGREVEIGIWLNDGARIEAARQLRRRISEQQSWTQNQNLSGEV